MRKYLSLCFIASIFSSCSVTEESAVGKTVVIFDTDANNELDDQHALAYLLFNGNAFDVAGVTVNATRGGGNIDKQYEEAERVMRLCGYSSNLPLYKGANSNFDSIQNAVNEKTFDGSDAVDFIIKKVKNSQKPIVVLAVGKLTNLALALKKSPDIAEKFRLVWLGSNYPDPGEYNLDNDTSSFNYVLKTKVPFEMVTVRYGKDSGSGAVQATQEEINKRMPGLGPEIIIPVTGRHGGEFKNFGDYSVNLFQHIDYHGTPPARALFDMVAVAVVKDASWGNQRQIPGPLYYDNAWHDNPNNSRKIIVWENFQKEKILADFYNTLENYQLSEIVE
jgi:purine nucleosidase